MKKILSNLSIGLACIIALSCMGGCNKGESQVYYKYDGLEEMTYIVAERSTAVAFFEELGNIMSKYDGTIIIESRLKSDIDKVVKKYDNGVVSGRFYLKKSTKSEDGPWTSVQSWKMNFASKYTKGDDFEVEKFTE